MMCKILNTGFQAVYQSSHSHCEEHHEPACTLSSPVLSSCNIDAEPDPRRTLSSFTIKRLPLQPPPIITILYCNYSSLFNYLDHQLQCSYCHCLFWGKRELTCWISSEEILIRHFSGNFRRALYYYCWIQITAASLICAHSTLLTWYNIVPSAD